MMISKLTDQAALDTQPPAARVLSSWNGARTNYPRDLCIHELFEEQARLAPDATALVFEKSALTYAALDARANALARRLAALGVARETPVAIFAERSPDLIAALLAVLKAGGFYVPLDTACPRERLAFMLADV